MTIKSSQKLWLTQLKVSLVMALENKKNLLYLLKFRFFGKTWEKNTLSTSTKSFQFLQN